MEVFAYNDKYPELGGRVLLVPCDADIIPSASYIPTMRELHERAGGFLTLAQCRDVKRAIYAHCRYFFNR